MTSNARLIINTLAQNIRTLLNIVLSLYSTRIVLQALGQESYGIYMLVAGIVSLLSYLSNTLVITTQRHLSFATGSGNIEGTKQIFANSYLLHLLIGIILAAGCMSLVSLIFDSSFLNIAPNKIYESKIVYAFVIVSVFMTFITSPFKSLLVAHENIVYISIIDVLDGILKLLFVFCLYMINEWRLAMYAAIMAGIMAFHFIMLAAYSITHYEECILIPRISMWDNGIQKKIISFATWTLYGMLCIYVRTQGIAVIVNRLISTVANAALGIATQLYGSIQFLSQSLINAISPQIIKAEGANDRQRAIKLSFMASKYSFLIMCMVSVPLAIEIPTILKLWLGEVPENASLFCRMMLLSSLVDQITIGLGTLNQAIGNIRNYTLITFTTKVCAIPAAIILLNYGTGIYSIVVSYFIFELLSALIRLPLLVCSAGVRITDYMKDVILRTAPAVTAIACVGYAVVKLIPPFCYRFLLTGVACVVIGVFATLLSAMTSQERTILFDLIKKRKK